MRQLVHLDKVKDFNLLYCIDMNAQSLPLEREREGYHESLFVWMSSTTNLSKRLRSIARVNRADSALKVAK